MFRMSGKVFFLILYYYFVVTLQRQLRLNYVLFQLPINIYG